MPFSFMKEKLEFLDADKCECKSTVVEGGGIGVAIESAASHIKVEPAAGGGSVVKVDVKDEIVKAKVQGVCRCHRDAQAQLLDEGEINQQNVDLRSLINSVI